MIFGKIFVCFLCYLLAGLLVAILTSGSLAGDEDRDYDYFLYGVILWPVALIIRTIKFLIFLAICVINGLKEEFR